MNNILSVWIAMRYMRSKKNERSVSFFSAVSFLGLTLGVAAIIVVMSVMNGFEREMNQRILGMLPHISVENSLVSNTENAQTRLGLENWFEYADALEKHSVVKKHLLSVTPYVHLDTLIQYTHLVKPLRLVGIEPELAKQHSVLTQYMLTAPLDSLHSETATMILGSDIARELGVMMGDKLTLMLPAVINTQLQVRFARFEVAGFFDVGSEADGLLAFVHIRHASELKYPKTENGFEKIDGLQIQLHDVHQVAHLSKMIDEIFSQQFALHTWQETYGQLFQTVKIEKVLTASMLMLIVLVAAFNTVSSLNLMVSEKHSSLAVLRTMGLKKNDLVWIFFIQGFLISCAGIVTGLLLGVLIALELENLIQWINSWQIVWFAPLKADLNWLDVFYLCMAALLISVLAASLPAIRATRIQAADAVRYH